MHVGELSFLGGDGLPGGAGGQGSAFRRRWGFLGVLAGAYPVRSSWAGRA